MALFKVKPWYKKRGGMLSYYGSVGNFTNNGAPTVASAFNTYALFSGGSWNYNITVINELFTKLQDLTTTVYGFGQGVPLNDGIVYIGAEQYDSSISNYSNDINKFNNSLTRSTLKKYDNPARYPGRGFINNTVVVAGGYNGKYSKTTGNLSAYTSALTYCYSGLGMISARSNIVTASTPQYVILAGGLTTNSSDSYSYDVQAVNSSYTVVNCSNLTHPRVARIDGESEAAVIGDYVLLGGNDNMPDSSKDAIEVYSKSLTRLSPIYKSTKSVRNCVATLGNYALFIGGMLPYTNIIDSFDTSLTKSNVIELPTNRWNVCEAVLGNYLLVGRGQGTSNCDGADIFQVA